jgi:C-terminal processing protease CtpA/Prc
MILRNIVLLLVLSLFLFNSSFGGETKTNYIIKDTANYIHKKSYFYEKTKYDGIFKKSISAINSYSEEILIKILERNSYKIVLQIQGKDKTSQLKLQRNSSIKDVGRNLTLLLEVLRRDYSLKKEDMQLNYLIANTMLQEVDEYSSIIHPDFYDDFLIESKGSFGGLGIVIGMRDERLTIISPIEGTPAFKAGVKANDKISRIENFET